MSNPYTQVIDLTQKAQRERKEQLAIDEMGGEEDALPSISVADLPERVQQAFSAAGWSDLMPVQQQAMPYLLEGRDLIVQSRTGSGKTGAFLLPMFDLLDLERKETQALILTPTRELARQIYDELERMKLASAETHDLTSVLVYGGVKYGPQIRGLKDGAQVVIGTPGRILDHLEKRNFSLNTLKMLVFDEADEMLSMGFYPAMQQLKHYLPDERQSCMFSATIPPKVRSLSKDFLDDPAFLSLSTGQISVDTIEHRYFVVDRMDKDRAVVQLIEMENPDSAIIFANTKRDVEYLAHFLQNYGYNADEISGDLTQKAREEAMGKLKDGRVRFLVATDVAARGIDISDLSHVFMYDVPQDPEYYVHRSGRTARAGKAGIALVFATVEDERSLQSIGAKYGIDLEKRELPSDLDVAVRVGERLTVMLEAMMREKSKMDNERLQRFVPLVRELAVEEPELLALLIDQIYMEQLHGAPDGPEGDDAAEERPARKERSGRGRKGKSRGGRR